MGPSAPRASRIRAGPRNGTPLASAGPMPEACAQLRNIEGLRLLIADDHGPFREFLTQALRRYSDCVVIGEARDGLEAICMVEELHPNAVLIDIEMPRLDGIRATRAIHALQPGVRIVGLSLHRSEAMRQAMIAAGAVALVPKTDRAEPLVHHLLAELSGVGVQDAEV